MKLFLAALLTLFPFIAEALTKQECIRLGDDCHWSKATGGRINGWFFEKAKGQSTHAGSNPILSAVAALDDAAGGKRMADRSRKSVALAGVDRRDAKLGAAADELRPVDRVWAQSPEVEHAKEVMRSVSGHNRITSPETRPRSAFLPAGAAQIFPLLPAPSSLAMTEWSGDFDGLMTARERGR